MLLLLGKSECIEENSFYISRLACIIIIVKCKRKRKKKRRENLIEGKKQADEKIDEVERYTEKVNKQGMENFI